MTDRTAGNPETTEVLVGWIDMASAAKDGSMLRLLVYLGWLPPIADQVVTDAMVDAAFSLSTCVSREEMRAALKAAMEAGR